MSEEPGAVLVKKKKGALKVMEKSTSPESPDQPRFLNSVQRREIRESVPPADWDEFSGLKHVAISIRQARILDGDNSLSKLTARVKRKFPTEEIFSAAGKGSLEKKPRSR